MKSQPLSKLWIPLLALAGWMLAAHPYLGIWHDGTLYFGQALLHSRVPQLAQDLFFASGSQDRYSVYALIVKPLYAVLGQPATHITAVLGSWALMVGGVLALLRPLPGSAAAWGAAAFAVVSPIYGGGWIFGYAEQFLTARTFAEPLLLWSLVALMRQWRLAMAGLLAAAAACHPLMTLPVLTVVWCHGVRSDRRWLWALALLPAVLAAGAAGIPPWDGLLRPYDPHWWSLVNAVNVQVIPGNWAAVDISRLGLDLAVLAAVARLNPHDGLSRLVWATVAATVLLMTACLVLVDSLHGVLATQLQLWRVHWITHLLAVVLAPWLVMRLWRLGGLWPASACALVLAMLSMHAASPHGAATVGLWAAVSAVAWRVREVSGTALRLACASIGLGIAATAASRLATLLELQGWQFPEAGWGGLFLLAASFPAIALPVFAGLLALQERGGAARGAAALLAVAFAATAAWHWDQRSDLARATESLPPPHPFAGQMPTNATVYWPGALAPVWGLLERPSHFALQQGSGMLFHRHNALSFGERRETYRGIGEDHEKCRNGAMLARDRQALSDCDTPKPERLVALCAGPDHPDFLVLPGRLPQPPLSTWQPPAHREPPQTFALYACRQIQTPP